MNKKIKDLVGQKFGRLLVLKQAMNGKCGATRWLCKCECGNETIVFRTSLISGNTKSCGCIRSEKASEMLCGPNNPMKRPEVITKRSGENHHMKKLENKIKFMGDNSPTKRPEVRKKISDSHKGSLNPGWIDGRSHEPYCMKWTPELRERIRSFFGYRCVVCGKSQEENITNTGRSYKLDCHHVEYNKEACCNERPVQFVTLCKSCHSKTNFNRIQWEYIFHKIIDEIYDGKSYYTKEEYNYTKTYL